VEPENNVAMILEAFSKSNNNLVFVGNWGKGSYGKYLRQLYSGYHNIFLLDPVFDPRKLRSIRDHATVYVHGHSAGGTNPSLVEMMHFGVPVVAYACEFNRLTTENKALYFSSVEELRSGLDKSNSGRTESMGRAMLEIANRRYRWEVVAKKYFDLFSEL
jgi:glycosyltransferase involved in cell wall biosynthesis